MTHKKAKKGQDKRAVEAYPQVVKRLQHLEGPHDLLSRMAGPVALAGTVLLSMYCGSHDHETEQNGHS